MLEKKGWEKWILQGLLTGIGLIALGMWNDLHEMKGDLRAHVAKEDEINAFQDFRLGKHADKLEKSAAVIGDHEARIKVLESRKGMARAFYWVGE